MKRYFFFFICSLVISHSNAQVTFVQSDYAALPIGADSLRKTTYNSPFPLLTAADDGVWDLSTVIDSTPLFFNYRVAAATPYQFADSNNYFFSSFAYQGNVQTSFSGSALLQYGIDIKYRSYSVGALLTDSVFIPAQNSLYTSSRKKIFFPASFNSFWLSDYRSDLNYEITYLLASLSHAPGIVRTYHTEKDTVIGWGKMRVKDADGNPSDYISVLQVCSMVKTIDSFLLNGSTTDIVLPSLLPVLGFAQGQEKTTYTMSFYRKGEVTPLAEITFIDAAFTQPAWCTYHRQRLPKPVIAAVAAEEHDHDISLYPNPVTMGHDIYWKLPQANGKWSFDIIDMGGRIIVTNKLAVTGNIAGTKLPASISPGSYCLRLYNGSNVVSIKPLTIY